MIERIRIPLASILAAAPNRRPGYLEACMAAGRVEGDWIEFEPEAFEHLRSQFGAPGAGADSPAGCGGCGG